MEDDNSNQISPNDAWLFRKATRKHVVIFFAVLAYVFSMFFAVGYSPRLGFILLGIFIVGGIIIYYRLPKEERRIIRDFSKDSSPLLLLHIRQLYKTGLVVAAGLALIFGMFLGVMMAKRTSPPEIADYIVLTAFVILIAAFCYGPYLLLVKRLLPQLKERLQNEKPPNKSVHTDAE